MNAHTTLFNGTEVSYNQNEKISERWQTKIKILTLIIIESNLGSEQALVQYIGVNCRLDLHSLVQLIAPQTKKIKRTQFTLL